MELSRRESELKPNQEVEMVGMKHSGYGPEVALNQEAEKLGSQIAGERHR